MEIFKDVLALFMYLSMGYIFLLLIFVMSIMME